MKDLSYLTDFYDEKIQRVKEIGAPLNFIFYTDPHNRLSEWDCPKHPDYAPTDFESAVDTIRSMNYILERLPELDCLVCGGDLGCDYNTDPQKMHESIEETMDELYKLPIPVHCVIGNHDDCICAPYFENNGVAFQDAILYPEDLHRICMKNNPTKENYYYHDFEEKGYRFIFLNTSDFHYGFDEQGELIHPIIVGVSREQVLWFREAVKTDKKVIVVSHSPIRSAGHYPDCTKGHEDMANGDWLWYEMQQAENVVACFSGHFHFDNIVYDGKLVSITTDAGTALYHGGASHYREFGTISETCFDIISIKDEVIYCTRFGAGYDRIARIIRNFVQE